MDMDDDGIPREDCQVKFLKPLRPITIRKNEPILLEAIVESQPAPKIYWFHDSRKIKDSRFHHISEQRKRNDDQTKILTTSQLEIAKAHPNDSGKYTVRAINRCGVRTSSVNVNILGEY